MQLSFIRGNFLANGVLGEDKHPINQKNVKSTTNKTENFSIQYEQANLTHAQKYAFTKKIHNFYSINMKLRQNNLPRCRLF